jgi:hypothetical protein
MAKLVTNRRRPRKFLPIESEIGKTEVGSAALAGVSLSVYLFASQPAAMRSGSEEFKRAEAHRL